MFDAQQAYTIVKLPKNELHTLPSLMIQAWDKMLDCSIDGVIDVTRKLMSVLDMVGPSHWATIRMYGLRAGESLTFRRLAYMLCGDTHFWVLCRAKSRPWVE